MRSPHGVDEHDLTVTGTLDLRSVGTVVQPFRCLDCQFMGPVIAPDVVFQRIVVLSGSQFHDRIDLRGAVFQHGLFVRTSRHASVFDGFSLFSLSTIADVAAFDGATFRDEANFTGVRFEGDASFVDTTFATVGRFTQASFGGSALFFTAPRPGGVPTVTGCRTPVPGTFGTFGIFSRAVFTGPADFRLRCFAHADFRSATFHSKANFTQAQFRGPAAFDNSSMEGDGLFVSAIFQTEGSFVQVAVARSLDFEGASFRAGDFSGLTVSGTLSFADTAFRSVVRMHRVVAAGLQLEPSNAERVMGLSDRERVLAIVESSATASGDLATANDAHFRLLSLENTRSSGPKRWIDSAFYKGVAGYLVSPIHPLIAFFVLLVVLGIARGVGRRRTHRRARKRPDPTTSRRTARGARTRAKARRAPLGVVQWAGAIFEGMADTMANAFRRKPDVTIEDRERVGPYVVAGARWAESIAFKVLIALFLICLASSNATLRQLVDSVTR
jgi:uncharacterized protein YjbI with pentapeptide repeats